MASLFNKLAPLFTREKYQSQTVRLVLVLFILSSLSQLSFLSNPEQVVFDEYHFGKFATSYCCSHERIFDVHPPHSKLLIAGAASVMGYSGDVEYDRIGEPYPEGDSFALRFFPALIGILIPLVFFQLLRQLRASNPAAFFGALLLVFDNALTVQTRLIALDGMLIFFTLGAISLFFSARNRQGAWQWVYFALCGMAIGMAIGTKYTGMVALGMVGLCMLVYLCKDLSKDFSLQPLQFWILRGLTVLVSGAFVFVLGWWLHFQLLDQPGSGDIWGQWSGDFWHDFFHVQSQMFSANSGLDKTHHDGSYWWQWPLMDGPIFYWSSLDGESIYLIGNPLVWWGSTLLLIVMLGSFFLSKVSDLKLPSSGHSLWLPAVGLVASYGPLILVPRVLFMYHYFTPLLFVLMLLVLWLDKLHWIQPDKLSQQRTSVYLVVIALVGFYLALSPMTYGLKFDAYDAQWVFQLFPHWR